MDARKNSRSRCGRRFIMEFDVHALAIVVALACLQTAHCLSVEVTRIAGQSDQFSFLDETGQVICGESGAKSCEDYGGTSEACNSSGKCPCRRCRCGSSNPTFLPHVLHCAGGENITSVLREGNFTGCDFRTEASDSPAHACPTDSLVTLNTSVEGAQNFCVKGYPNTKVSNCQIHRHQSMFLEKGRWKSLSSRASFTSKTLQIQWTPFEHNFTAVISLQVSCVVKTVRFFPHGSSITVPKTVKSCLLFKSSGSRKFWLSADPNTTISPSPSQLTVGNVTDGNASIVVTTELPQESSIPATTSRGFEEATIGDGANKALLIVAVILAAVLLAVIAFATMFAIRRRMRSSSKRLEHGHLGNPMYGRGPDQTFMGQFTLPPHDNGVGHIYQPLVENSKSTRVPGESRTLANFSPRTAVDGASNILPEPIPRCFSECTYQEAKARSRPKDVVCTPNPIYQEVIPCNGSAVFSLGLHPPPLPKTSRPRTKGNASGQGSNCKPSTRPVSSQTTSYLELLSDDGIDSAGYLHPVEHLSPQRKVPDSQRQDQSSGKKCPNKRPPSYNTNQTLPKLPCDVEVENDESDGVEIARPMPDLSDDPLLTLTIEHDVDDDVIEISPPISPSTPVVSVAVEVENPTLDRPVPSETEVIVPKYGLHQLATQV